MDWTLILVKLCFKPKFHCVKTINSVIIPNVFVPYFLKQLLLQLKQINCFTILNDTSDHGDKKLFSVLVRYFDAYSGILVKLLELESQRRQSKTNNSYKMNAK